MSEATGPVVVEFAGIPGSGKTTLSRIAAEGLRSKGFGAFTVIEAARIRASESTPGGLLRRFERSRLARLALWWMFYAASSIRAILFIWRFRTESIDMARTQGRRAVRQGLKAHTAWWYVQLGGRRMYLDSSRSIDAVLYDDGFAHRSVALFSSPGESGLTPGLDEYLRTVPTPDVVVHVRADVDTCLRRVVNRGVWRHSRTATSEDLADYLEAARGILERTVEAIGRRGTTVIEVDNYDDSIDESSARLIDRLSTVLEPATRGLPT